MDRVSAEAIIVAGSGVTADEQLPKKGVQRMDTAITAWRDGIAPNLAVSGDHSYLLKEVPSITEAGVMEDYAEAAGVPRSNIFAEHRSLDTIGNALFTKTDIVIPQDWENLIVVTSGSHLPRALIVFNHVYGKDFNIAGMAAPEEIGAKELMWEFVGNLVVKSILRDTKPGDHETIRERLYDLVPGYGHSTLPRLAASIAKGYLLIG